MVRKRGKRSKRKSFGTSIPRQSFVALQHEPPNIPKEELIKAVIATGKQKKKDFEELIVKIQESFRSFEPLHLLSILSVYGLSVGMTESGKTKSKKPFSFSLPHAELAQAFALKIPKHDISNKLAEPCDIQNIWDLLLSLSESFSLKRFALVKNTTNKNEQAILMLQEHVRLQTQNVRNWTYFKSAMKIYNKLYSPLDHIYEVHIGISATNLIRIFNYIIEYVEQATNQHWQRMRPVIKSKSINQAVSKYYEVFPDLKESANKLIDFLNKNSKNLSETKVLLMSHADLRLSKCFTISVSSIAKALQLNEKQLDNVLSCLSLTFGDLAQYNPEHFFLDNPVWSKPLIRLQNGSYFCILPIVFTNFGFRIIEQLIQDEKLKFTCSKRRSEFLENEINSLFRVAFPQAKISQNLIWPENGKSYETDFLLKFESSLLIVEAKSGSISTPALRGAPKRLKQHIQNLIIDPAQQSLRLKKKVLAAQSNPTDHSAFLKKIPFDISDIKNILRLSVTLEDFADIQANLSLLEKGNFINQDFSPVPTIMLADLTIIMDILETPAEKIHYLLRRNELENYRIKFYGSEMDILGLYLENGLNIASVQDKDMGMFLMEMSEPIDEYYVAQDFNIIRKKPRLKLTTWWHDILSRLEAKRPTYWLEASIILLNYPVDEQTKAEKAFRKIKKRVQKDWRNPNHMNSVIIAPPYNRQDALALIALKKQNWSHRHDLIKNISAGVFEDTHATRCLALGVNIDSKNYPYSIAGILFRKKPIFT